MKERPILFSAPMVRAILEGRKTQTRRVVKPQPFIDKMGNFCWNGWNFGQDSRGPHIQAIASPIPSSKTKRVHCPYGKPGDRLWVRETWRIVGNGPDDTIDMFDRDDIQYRADDDQSYIDKYRRSIHMPRWASRILLEVTGVRVERLQDISEADAKAEGADCLETINCTAQSRELLDLPLMDDATPYRNGYALLWESINGDGSWAANPWVWVVEFKLVEGGAA